MGYDPQSTDAMFSRIIQRLDAQDEILRRIEAQTVKTNGRVSSLERWRDVTMAKVAVMSAGVSSAVALGAWLIKILREG